MSSKSLPVGVYTRIVVSRKQTGEITIRCVQSVNDQQTATDWLRGCAADETFVCLVLFHVKVVDFRAVPFHRLFFSGRPGDLFTTSLNHLLTLLIRTLVGKSVRDWETGFRRASYHFLLALDEGRYAQESIGGDIGVWQTTIEFAQHDPIARMVIGGMLYEIEKELEKKK